MASSPRPAQELWDQFFKRAIADPHATLHDPEYDEERSFELLAKALRHAGWSELEVTVRVAAAASAEPARDATSPGVGPTLEPQLRNIAERVKAAMSAMGYTGQENVLLGIDPRAGVSASLTNVIMTDEGIISVSSFLFRWCALIARSFLRTLNIAPYYWSDSPADEARDLITLGKRPDLMLYWIQIFSSFAATGTHVMVPFRPSNRTEAIIFEQIAWAMEFYVISHEYAHHALNHRSIFEDQKQQEFDADALAMRICEHLQLEPFPLIHNPYASTGASATLMLRALSILRSFQDRINRNGIASDTHPLAAERIERIANRHLVQPSQFKMDRNFNGTVGRIMNAVETRTSEFLEEGGAELIIAIREKIDG